MSINFKIWSEINNEAKKAMAPNLKNKDWDGLSLAEKEKIWDYLSKPFFTDDKSVLRIYLSIHALNESNKPASYGEKFLKDRGIDSAIQDFKNIFLNEKSYVVLDLLSYFSKQIIEERAKESLPRYRYADEPDKEYYERNNQWRLEQFNEFKNRLNEIFEQFGITVILTQRRFTFRQDKKIINEIYEPVLNFLGDSQWEMVNREIEDSFQSYNQSNKKGYSKSITHAVNAIEAFLQILVYKKTTKDTLKNLVVEAKKKGLIPDDFFTDSFLKNIQSILARERKEKGDAHTKKTYATEKDAQLVLNLTMIFLQYCIQNIS